MVISTLTVSALGSCRHLPSLHVTDSGHVLVCGGFSNNIVQVDRGGRQILAKVVT
ncbi:hypothetical protein DPMN_149537 [Dreissena polymorpha]|uniref:Uncharacterized protein n=1 Tax=Dreissena polymorpha TaxID=45954 RepID=A0A9D4FDY8_DREPO|nr:hypothetical protein DPMN_149537 [Dreissena polymorpha]